VTTQRAYARFAGAMYLTVLALDISGVVIGSAVSGSGSFADVSQRILASETLYRITICLALGGSLATVMLAVGLYVTVRPADPNLALMALVFRVAEAAIGGVGIALAFSVLQVRLATGHSNAFDVNQLGALADLFSHGDPNTHVGAIFFCFGSTIFFYVFLKSGYIPRLMSVWGVFSSVLYAAAWVFGLIVPEGPVAVMAVASIPILIAEVSTGLWLLIAGIKVGETQAGYAAAT
jgi:hypothetical protein